jgi:hypothetical protein
MAQEMTPAMYAQHAGIKESLVRNWLLGRTGYKFDPRDVRWLTRNCPLITVAAPNASGQGARPRLIHVSSGAPTMDVVSQEDGGSGGVPHPAGEHVDGHPTLGVESGEGVTQALEVHDGKGSR